MNYEMYKASSFVWKMNQQCILWNISQYPTIIYCWTEPVILDHSYLVGNLTNSKIAETKALELLKSDTFVSAIFELVDFPTRHESSKIRGTVHQ
jgi:hypothetical protein